MIIDETIDNETLFELSALLLSLNRKTFEAVASLKQFPHILGHFTQQKIETLDELYHLQHAIIRHLSERRAASTLSHLHDSFVYLQKESLIDKLSLDKLISLFDPSSFNENNNKEIIDKTTDENFHIDRRAVLMDIDELRKVIDSTNELDAIVEYLRNQKFSIGITGVMNAGKSTMLNALMGREVLGTNVIPETANLTVVKYSKAPSAKVVYWNKYQWQHIQNSAKSIEAIADFVKQTQKHFKENIDSYILQTSREDEIDIDSLSNYTSASSSDKKCNLVKHVELGYPLPFLQDGIEIVDTPGLDDIVIQREEITKEYLSKCDLMIHLMNVSQSATKKDIEFIIDSVLYQNITKVLIVITRTDMVSRKDVEEVIEYTKHSISNELNEQEGSSKLEFILKNLHFIALSGKMALLHKTGKAKEAEDAGYSIEKSGILEIEDYLQETLFSKHNTRSSLIIRSAKNRLNKVIYKALQELKFESSLLFKNEDETNEELSILKIKKNRQQETLERLKYQIEGYEAEASNYLERLQNFLENELIKLKTIIRQRIMDETRYSLEKDKQTPQIAAQTRIIESALKHGLVDILREYRYKFIKKSSKISQVITLQYDEIKQTDEDIYSDFNHQTIFDDAFKQGFLTANTATLIQRVSKVLKTVSLSKLDKTDDEIKKIIKEEFIYLETGIKDKALKLSRSLLEEFFTNLRKPINTIEKTLEQSESILENHMAFLKEDESSRSKKSIQLYERIKIVELIAKRYNI